MQIREDRSLLSFYLLGLVTCGIYWYYFFYKLAQDTNTVCAGDGEETAGLLKFILLSLVTCGIYSYIWYYNLGNRYANNAARYGLNFQENGTTVLLWMLLGSFIVVGPFIAYHILFKNMNALAHAYNNR